MPNDGSLEVLPISPCTPGSLHIDSLFSSTTPLKVVENRSTVSLVDTLPKQQEIKAEGTNDEETHLGHNDHEDKEEKMVEDKKGEEEVKKEDHEHHIETEVVVVSTVSIVADNNETTKEDPLNVLTEKTATTSLSSTTPSAEPTENHEEKIASGVANRPILSGTLAQSRYLSAASLELKKKQEAENTAKALRAVDVELPERDSITSRIKMFGGATHSRTVGFKKINVKDIIRKYKNVEEQSQEHIAHVAKGYSANEPRGVCAAYSLSTASRPTTALRPTPRRKMSYELSENDVRESSRRGSNDEERMGVSQESVQSVRNAKSLFENLGRAESAGAQL